MAGLQRRRAPIAADEDGLGETSPGIPTHNVYERPSGSGSIAAVDLRSGKKYAYDPRDMLDTHEQSAHPRLTLTEEVLLLGLKDRQGHFSFWNDNLSYTLRGTLLMELALRRRIRIVAGSAHGRAEVADALLEVCSAKTTGEPLLDETVRLLQANPPASIRETWNVAKLGLQLKQVRERLAKGLVEKHVLRTEARTLFTLGGAAHPLADPVAKAAVIHRAMALLTAKSPSVHVEDLYKEEPDAARFQSVARSLCLVCCAYAGDVLENTLGQLRPIEGERVMQHAAHLLRTFAQWPMAPDTPGGGIPSRGASDRASRPPPSSSRGPILGVTEAELVRALRREISETHSDAAMEILAGVLQVLAHRE